MMTFRLTVILKCLLIHHVIHRECNGETIDGASFAEVLQTIANDALGVSKVQEHYDSLQYRNSYLDGVGLVTEISASLSAKFDGPIQALKRIKQTVEQDIDSYTISKSLTECCHATGLTNSTKFRTKVNLNDACVTISSDSPTTRTIPNQRLRDIMIDNHRNNPNLKWQYFGKEDGVFINYPSIKLDDCSNYDPRFRPFYVTTATPVQKDIVVIIDRSGSMNRFHGSRSLLQIAKEAAISVLETLNPNDRFGMVAFDSTAYVPGRNKDRRSCHGNQLAQATPLNINFMKSQVNAITLGGATNYEAALNTAFRFFIDSNNNGVSHEKVILFLTDGVKTSGGDPLVAIRESNKQLNNSVFILTYGLGEDLGSAAISMLKDMADQTMTDKTYGEVKVGEFQHIKNPDYLRTSMASYYNRFSSTEKVQNPIFSVPYQDLFGIGLISSICLPAYRSDSSLIGVACSDVTMSDIMADISYFREGELSYAFIIDGSERTLMHPLLPLPYDVKADPIYVDIQNLERSSMAVDVIESMKSGMSGNMTINSRRTVPRGDMLHEGIETKIVLSHYYWKPVRQSNFSVCIVVGDQDKQPILDQQTVTSDSFVYHRLDHTTADRSNCRHFRRYATKDKSVVMLTPAAFKEPFNYLDTLETSNQIAKYENFLTGKDALNNPGLKDSVLNSVAATYSAEAIWKRNEELAGFVVWRYIGTTDGVMRLYPGVEIAKNYDHTRRGWYKRTIALKGVNVISAPYLDLWGSGYLITLSKTITEGRVNGQLLPDSPIVAVIGTDFTINYFYQMLMNTYSFCQSSQLSCFVIDSSGLIVIHEDFVNTKTTSPEIENVHITYKEKAIAVDMLQQNIMTKTSCIDFGNIKEQFTYRTVMGRHIPLSRWTFVDKQYEPVSTNGRDRMDSYAKYKIEPVPNSNIFILYKQRVLTPASCCSSYHLSPDRYKCSTTSCSCLCYEDANFDYCKNSYILLRDAPQTCSPREPKLETENLNDENKIQSLSYCFDPKCSTRNKKSECFSVAGCSWCVRDQYGESLDKEYCDVQSACYFGQVGAEDPYGCTGDTCTTPVVIPGEEGGLGGGAIAGIIIGVIVVLLIIGVAFYCCRKSESHKPTTQRSDSSYPSSSAQPSFHQPAATGYPQQSHAQPAAPSYPQQSHHGGFHDNVAFYPQNQTAGYNVPSAPQEDPPPYSAIY